MRLVDRLLRAFSPSGDADATAPSAGRRHATPELVAHVPAPVLRRSFEGPGVVTRQLAVLEYFERTTPPRTRLIRIDVGRDFRWPESFEQPLRMAVGLSRSWDELRGDSTTRLRIAVALAHGTDPEAKAVSQLAQALSRRVLAGDGAVTLAVYAPEGTRFPELLARPLRKVDSLRLQRRA